MSFEPPQNPYESPQSPHAGGPPEPTREPSSDERMWAMLCHVAGLGLYTAVPFGNIVLPLIVWLIKKDEYPLVDDQGKEAVNFQISITIYLIVSAILVVVIIGIFLLIAVAIFNLVVIIIAAMKANEGVAYRYPMCIRFIS